jgi:hypothetical protein
MKIHIAILILCLASSIYAIDKAQIKYYEKDYNFHSIFNINGIIINLNYKCKLSRDINNTFMTIIEKPKFESDNAQLGFSIQDMNNAFEILVGNSISIPYDFEKHQYNIEKTSTKVLDIAGEMTPVIDENNKSLMSMISTYLTFIYTFTIFNVILPDLNENDLINVENGKTITEAINNMIWETVLNDNEYLQSRKMELKINEAMEFSVMLSVS